MVYWWQQKRKGGGALYLDGLDALDRQILELLIGNARLSYSEIGERVGISRVAVKSHMEALEKQGIIEAYTTVVNPQKLSGAISVYLELETAPDALQEVTERLYRSETVTQIYRMTGACCLHVHAVAPEQAELERFLHDEVGALPGVRKLQSHVILARIKDVKGLRL